MKVLQEFVKRKYQVFHFYCFFFGSEYQPIELREILNRQANNPRSKDAFALLLPIRARP
jgi:hypothetical protein